MLPIGNMSKVYPPPGHCLYCGIEESADVSLHREHIFPFAINGTLIALKASCRRCATIINDEFENPILTKTLGFARAHLKTATRSRQRGRKRLDRFTCMVVVNGRLEQRTFQIEDLPGFILLDTEPPYLLSGKPSEEGVVKAQRMHLYKFPGTPLVPGLQLFQQWIGGTWERWMAKIAHSYAMSEGALCGYQNLLPDVILGQDKFLSNYCGTSDVTAQQMSEMFQGSKSFNRIALDSRIVGPYEYLTAHVQIFAVLNAPVYQVIVGRRASHADNSVLLNR